MAIRIVRTVSTLRRAVMQWRAAGERIADVGPATSVQVPAGARVIDLSAATVLPGLIDGHVHTMGGPSGLQYQMMLGLANAQRDLNAGFTTIVDMGSHGGWFGTVELKKAIDSGVVKGPRMQVSGPVWTRRGSSSPRSRWL